MRSLTNRVLVFLWAVMACAVVVPQPVVTAKEGMVRGQVATVNPGTSVMMILVQPGESPMNLYGVDRARIEKPGGGFGTVAELRPGTPVTVYYSPHRGHWYPSRILIPDPNLAIPATPLTQAEERALDSKAAHDGDITTNPGVKARIDRDVTTQPGRKDPADPDITKRPITK